DGRARVRVPGQDGVCADSRTLSYLDWPKHLCARSDHDAVAQRRVPLSADASSRIGAAQSHVLIDGDLIADVGCLADDAKAMIEEEMSSDLCARVNVDPGQEAREVVYQAGDKIELAFPEPVREPV